MAIHLITGVPGAGKSLRAVWQAVERIKTEQEQDRPIFGNVRGFRRQAPLPGSKYQTPEGEFQDIPGEWMDCPDGSIIMIDECQERWRRYRNTGEPPAEIAALERHRHRNIDFILTCQNPKQLSDDVRSLVDTHEHLTKRGKGTATVYRWSGRCSTSPYTNKKDADCEVDFWRYPKWIFDEYKSANEHTVRNKIPRIFIVGVVMLLLIPASFAFAYKQISGMGESANVQQYMVDDEMAAAAIPGARTGPIDTVQVSATPSTPEMVEVIGGAVMGERCNLYAQGGTRIYVTWEDCMNTMETGFPAYVIEINF